MAIKKSKIKNFSRSKYVRNHVTYKEMSLQNFSGSWKQSDSQKADEFFKELGLSAPKRFVAKYIKSTLKYEMTLSHDTYVLTEGSNPPRIITFGLHQIVDANLGEHDYVVEFEEESQTLCAFLVMKKPRSDLGNLKVGDKLSSRTRIIEGGKLESRVTYKSVTMVKVFSRE